MVGFSEFTRGFSPPTPPDKQCAAGRPGSDARPNKVMQRPPCAAGSEHFSGGAAKRGRRQSKRLKRTPRAGLPGWGLTRFSKREAANDPPVPRAPVESVPRSLLPASGDPADVVPGPCGFPPAPTPAPASRGSAARRHGWHPPVEPGHPPLHCHARANAARLADPLIGPTPQSRAIPSRFLSRFSCILSLPARPDRAATEGDAPGVRSQRAAPRCEGVHT